MHHVFFAETEIIFSATGNSLSKLTLLVDMVTMALNPIHRTCVTLDWLVYGKLRNLAQFRIHIGYI